MESRKNYGELDDYKDEVCSVRGSKQETRGKQNEIICGLSEQKNHKEDTVVREQGYDEGDGTIRIFRQTLGCDEIHQKDEVVSGNRKNSARPKNHKDNYTTAKKHPE